MAKIRAPRNRTITLSTEDEDLYSKDLIHISEPVDLNVIENRIANQDLFQILEFIPEGFVDLLILDPPYNIDKVFRSTNFRKKTVDEYVKWFESWFIKLLPTLKNTATVYICSDWYSSTAVHLVLEKYLKIRNRITWEREKGRGAKKNYKNSAEDIWFATVSDDYVFNVEDIKLKRRVLAPYTDDSGSPKDWHTSPRGHYRLTHPSNLWNDITVPFWSMSENTDHPTQKPEKLMAKLILASTDNDDFVFDPFAGVGSSLVTAKKLGRRFFGVEIDKEYSLLTLKRLRLAELDESIQGYCNGVFWERNTLNLQQSNSKKKNARKFV